MKLRADAIAFDASRARRCAAHALAGVLIWVPAACLAVMPPFFSIPSFESVRAQYRPSDVQIQDRNGVEIGSIRVDFNERRGAWLSLSAISPALQRAVLLSEDRNFHHHGGVDWTAILAAGWGWAWKGMSRGASTLSMQLVGMLDPALNRPAGGRSLEQKYEQILAARRLESRWSKQEILEAYLNLVAFRGELRGVDALARVVFRKYAHGLTSSEAAVAAALLRGPNASVQRVSVRACSLLLEMARARDCEMLPYQTARWLASAGRPAADISTLAPHFSRTALRHVNSSQPTILTTLDADLQRFVLQSVHRHLAGMGNSKLTDAAVVVLHNRSGEILAYVGASGEMSDAPQVDHARAPRQAGSTLKPFLYAQAFERRHLTAASLLDDSALDVSTASGLYIPQNYDQRHVGLVSARKALAGSLNIPAVRVLVMLGPQRFAERLRSLGLDLQHDGEHYGYSLALGSADVDLLSLTNAYRALSQQGRWSDPVWILSPSEISRQDRQIIDPMASWVIGDILSDRVSRAAGFGLESVLSTRFWSAVKTGTSKDMRDNWTIGWSADYTVGVWVGNSQGLSMRDVSGVTGAAPIWHEVLSYLHRNLDSRQPPPPGNLQVKVVEYEGVSEAMRTEYFLPGTAMGKVRAIHTKEQTRPRIVSPAQNTVLAFDPDMPPSHQRLQLRVSGKVEVAGQLTWWINGSPVGVGREVLWFPRPGFHTVELQDEQGKVLDQVSLQVRNLPGR